MQATKQPRKIPSMHGWTSDDLRAMMDACERELALRGHRQTRGGGEANAPTQASKPVVTLAGLDDATLCSMVKGVTSSLLARKHGCFGASKVFIIAAWEHLTKDGCLHGTLDEFKHRLTLLNNRRLLDLARADLVEAMDASMVRDSEARYHGTTFHFIRA